MANKCAICGAEINLIQTQKLADGNCICRKNCRAKGMKAFDYIHSTLPQVKAHLAQVERGTKLWEHYFVQKMKEKDKTKKLHNFASNLYVAEDLGLMALIQNDYKFFIFGKSTRACVYRIADLMEYNLEEQEVKTSEGTKTEKCIRLIFAKTDGLFNFTLSISDNNEYNKISGYFDRLFGIQKTLGNAANNWKKQTAAIKNVAEGIKSVIADGEVPNEVMNNAADALDVAIYGDRTELIKKADEALAAFSE